MKGHFCPPFVSNGTTSPVVWYGSRRSTAGPVIGVEDHSPDALEPLNAEPRLHPEERTC